MTTPTPPNKFAVLAGLAPRQLDSEKKPQLLTVHCAICRNWSFEGEAAEARAQFSEHRARDHSRG